MGNEAEKKRALSRAYRLLAFRARTVEEIRSHLSRAEFSTTVVDEVVADLTRQGLLNDAEFADEWVRSRMRSRPRGKNLIRHELCARGVPRDVAEEAAATVDDEASARAIAVHRASSMRGLDRETFIRRLMRYLLTRGYTHATAQRAVNSVLSEYDDS
jgi:regulatory protein